MISINRRHFRSHEAGDERNIPSIFFDSQKLLDPKVDTDDLPFLHQALAASRAQGHCPVERASRQPDLLSVEGRKETFRLGWHEPHRNLMAAAGFYRAKYDQMKAICAFCHMECKGWQSGEDPWQRHKNLSPNCRLVKCAKRMGVTRCHSCTSLDILTR